MFFDWNYVGINRCFNQVGHWLVASTVDIKSSSWLGIGAQECNGPSLPATAPLSLIFPTNIVAAISLPRNPFSSHPFPIRSDKKNPPLHLVAVH